MEVLNIQGDVPTSAVVASGTPSSMGYGEELNAQHCWGGTGNTELFSGFGDLWTHTLYGPDVSMIWVTSLGTVADNIGVSLTRSIIVP